MPLSLADSDWNRVASVCAGRCFHEWAVLQEKHSGGARGLQAQLEEDGRKAQSAKCKAAAVEGALRDSLAGRKAKEEGVAGQIADLSSIGASLEASLGEQHEPLAHFTCSHVAASKNIIRTGTIYDAGTLVLSQKSATR